MIISKTTQENAKLPKDFLTKYVSDEFPPYFVNSFQYLNWPDPFPKESKNIEKEFAYLVYEEFRFT